MPRGCACGPSAAIAHLGTFDPGTETDIATYMKLVYSANAKLQICIVGTILT